MIVGADCIRPFWNDVYPQDCRGEEQSDEPGIDLYWNDVYPQDCRGEEQSDEPGGANRASQPCADSLVSTRLFDSRHRRRLHRHLHRPGDWPLRAGSGGGVDHRHGRRRCRAVCLAPYRRGTFLVADPQKNMPADHIRGRKHF